MYEPAESLGMNGEIQRRAEVCWQGTL